MWYCFSQWHLKKKSVDICARLHHIRWLSGLKIYIVQNQLKTFFRYRYPVLIQIWYGVQWYSFYPLKAGGDNHRTHVYKIISYSGDGRDLDFNIFTWPAHEVCPEVPTAIRCPKEEAGLFWSLKTQVVLTWSYTMTQDARWPFGNCFL